jgi:ABC-type proline/glycine betaine transport system ATPase subunit
MSQAAVEFQHVDILFSREAGRKGRAALRQALESLDTGGTRAQIAEQFGVVVGVADASCASRAGTSACSWACRVRASRRCCAPPMASTP